MPEDGIEPTISRKLEKRLRDCFAMSCLAHSGLGNRNKRRLGEYIQLMKEEPDAARKKNVNKKSSGVHHARGRNRTDDIAGIGKETIPLFHDELPCSLGLAEGKGETEWAGGWEQGFRG